MLLGATCTSFLYFSCNKKNAVSSASSRLVGKWKKVRYATDDNRNGILDSWEEHPTDPTILNELQFKGDSTGVETTTQAPELNFHWWLSTEGQLVVVYTTGDTTFYRISYATLANLYLTSNTNLGLVGYYYDIVK